MAELRQRQVATAGAGDAGAGRGAGAEARGAGGEEDADGLPALHPDTSILFPALALVVLAGASVRGCGKVRAERAPLGLVRQQALEPVDGHPQQRGVGVAALHDQQRVTLGLWTEETTQACFNREGNRER